MTPVQGMLDLAPPPPVKPLRLEQARVLLALGDSERAVTPWEITNYFRVGGLSLYERGWVASRLSELARMGCVEVVGHVDGPVGRPESLYALTAFGQSRVGEAHRIMEGK